jgi:hypothetical protein
MATEAGQPQENKKPEPYYGERKVKIGDPRADRRKLRDMMRGAGKPKKAGK